MKVLGIDTILHSTCAAVVEDGRVLSNEIKQETIPSTRHSLLNLTKMNVREIGGIIENALEKANVSPREISLIAVNNSGSLLSNVLIGLTTANVLSKINNIPLIAVEHQESHIFSNWIDRHPADFNFPILVFSASGAHHVIALIAKDDFKFKIITEKTGIRNKAGARSSPVFVGLGTLFSDVVCWLGLKNSRERLRGDGHLVSKLALKGDSSRFFNLLPAPQKEYISIDSICRDLRRKILRLIESERKIKGFLSRKFICDLAAGFESSLAETTINNLLVLAGKYKAKEIHLAGGVAANRLMRATLKKKTGQIGIVGRWPKKKTYCLDNAAMIADLGYWKFKRNPKKYIKKRHLDIKSDLKLEGIAVDQFLRQNKELK